MWMGSNPGPKQGPIVLGHNGLSRKALDCGSDGNEFWRDWKPFFQFFFPHIKAQKFCDAMVDGQCFE